MSEKKEPKQVSIEEMSVEQLKALAWDVLVELNKNQANLNIIQAEIEKKQKE